MKFSTFFNLAVVLWWPATAFGAGYWHVGLLLLLPVLATGSLCLSAYVFGITKTRDAFVIAINKHAPEQAPKIGAEFLELMEKD